MTTPITHKVLVVCPACHAELNCATGLRVSPPAPGDLNICIECLSPSVFTADLSIKLVAISELSESDAKEIEVLRRELLDMKFKDKHDIN